MWTQHFMMYKWKYTLRTSIRAIIQTLYHARKRLGPISARNVQPFRRSNRKGPMLTQNVDKKKIRTRLSSNTISILPERTEQTICYSCTKYLASKCIATANTTPWPEIIKETANGNAVWHKLLELIIVVFFLSRNLRLQALDTPSDLRRFSICCACSKPTLYWG